MKRFLALLCLLASLLTVLPALAEAPTPAPTMEITYKPGTTPYTCDTDTLKYSISTATINGTKCYLTEVWMAEPGRQMVKATSVWQKGLANARNLALSVEGCLLAVNGSGYVSPAYPWIPETYPGGSKDYYFTPLGSLTVTDGEVLRNLPGIPFYGLTLEADGLHLCVGEDNEAVLARHPTQTWSFYEQCPLIADGEDILDRTWDFANRRAARNIICKLDEHTYFILTVSSKNGLRLTECVDFLQQELHPLWAYNLDGGPSTALMRRQVGKKAFKVIYQNLQKNVDIIAFTE